MELVKDDAYGVGNTAMIQIRGICVQYGQLVAVDDLHLTALAGEILALLGPNAAGKTTTVRCIVGLLRPDAGEIAVAGHDVVADAPAARRAIGYVPEVAELYDALTPWEYLRLKGRLFGMEEASIEAGSERLLRGFGLLDRRHEPMVAFSKGMNQKVCLGAALLTDPQVLVLDEPLAGLDVETTLVVKEVMREFVRTGGTLLYCSHLLDVVETVADRVAVLDRGKLLACGTLQELREKVRGASGPRLEELFQHLTSTGDPVAQARALLDRGPDEPSDRDGSRPV